MAEPPTPSTDVNVAILRQRFAELRKRQAAARTTLVLLTVVIILFFGLFTYSTVTRVQGNFSQPAVQKAVSDRLPVVIPLAGAQLQKAAVNSLPVYRELAVQRYQVIRPELSAKAMARLDKVPEQSGKMMSEQLDASFAQVLKRIEPELKQTFPGLSDAQKQQIIADYFHDGIAARNKALASHIDGMYTNDLIAVHSALDKFDVPANDGTPNDRLQRDFLHSMLVLADYELLNGDVAPPGSPAMKAAPTTQASAAAQ